MRNHPNRSCAVVHRTLYAVQMASAKIDDLAAAYVAAHQSTQELEGYGEQRIESCDAALMIERIGVYRFRDKWPEATRIAKLPQNSQIVARWRVQP